MNLLGCFSCIWMCLGGVFLVHICRWTVPGSFVLVFLLMFVVFFVVCRCVLVGVCCLVFSSLYLLGGFLLRFVVASLFCFCLLRVCLLDVCVFGGVSAMLCSAGL